MASWKTEYKQNILAEHREPTKMPSKLNPPKYQFHHRKCMGHGLNGPPDQLAHPIPIAMQQLICMFTKTYLKDVHANRLCTSLLHKHNYSCCNAMLHLSVEFEWCVTIGIVRRSWGRSTGLLWWLRLIIEGSAQECPKWLFGNFH